MKYIILLACIGAIVAYIQLKKGEVLRFETLATPEQVVMNSVGQVGTKRRWATVSQTPTNVAFSYTKKPNIFALLVLLLLGIIPGIIYWVLRSKVESLNAMIVDNPSGNTQVQIASNGFQGKSAGRAIRDAVGVAPGTVAQAVDSDDGTIPMVSGTVGGLVVPAVDPTALYGGQPAATAGQDPAIGMPIPEQLESATHPAGWYPDPADASKQRYYDGREWR